MLFRFYDPAILRAFLPTCDASQLAAMFGPIEAYLIESAGGLSLVSLRCAQGGLARHTIRLDG